MSFGNVPESIPLDRDPLTLILGRNQDKGEDSGERNGVGKSSIVMALHFALFGISVGNKIKKPRLINNINQKNLEVTLKFTIGTNSYTIKRFRKPEKLEFYVDDHLVNDQGGDEGQGEMGKTQEEINRVVGITPDMFNQSIFLSVITEPFLLLGSGKQRELIEELLGITQLSEKSTTLKEMLRETKTQLDKETFKIKTVEETNARVRTNHEKSIQNLMSRETRWENEHRFELDGIEKEIAEYSEISINQEIKNHELLAEWLEKKVAQDQLLSELERTNIEKGRHDRAKQQAFKRLEDLAIDLESAEEQKCPTCGQDVHDDKHDSVLGGIVEKVEFYEKQLREEDDNLAQIEERLQELSELEFDLGKKPEVFYTEVKDAYKHKSTLKSLKDGLKSEKSKTNPYSEQIASQPDAPLQDINYELKDDLIQLRDHQEFLYKLLTSKDSSVRKHIINQNISYLNARLGMYLEKLGLPHEVEFLNDLSTEITMLGNQYDFLSLSAGERARLTLGLIFAFRDVWESLNQTMNIFFVDEFLDTGLDTAGVESALKTLKQLGRERAKNIFIISHREELISRCSNVLTIVKEGGFSQLEWQRDEEEV